MAVDYAAWLEGQNARILLAELTASSGGSTVNRYLASQTHVTGASDSPAHEVYDGVIQGPVDLERAMGSVFGDRGAIYNGGELTVVNVGKFDSWVYDNWRGQPIALYWGDPSWKLSDIKSEGQRFSGVIQSIEVVSDTQLRILYQSPQQKLSEPLQARAIYRHSKVGQLAHYCAGYPKNVPGWVVGTQESGVEDYEVNVHEHDVEDPAVARYKNQVVSTSPGVTKVPTSDQRHLDFTSDPEGMMTFDVKGAVDTSQSPAHWMTTPGEIIEHMLTREIDYATGVVQGSTATDKVELEPGFTSAIVGESLVLNGLDGSDEYQQEVETISAFDEGTNVATVDTAYSEFTPARGFGYRIPNQTVQLGQLDPDQVDSDAMDGLDADLPYECGIYEDQERSVEEVLQEILGPGAGYWWTAAGLLSAGILEDPASGTSSLSLTANDLIGDIQITQAPPPIWWLAVGYDKNFTVQRSGVAADGIDQERQNWINKEFRTVKRSDSSILDADPAARKVTVNTVFTSEDDALTELDRLWNLFSTQRRLYRFTCTTKVLQADISDVIDLTDGRFELAAKNMVILRIREHPLEEKAVVECWA